MKIACSALFALTALATLPAHAAKKAPKPLKGLEQIQTVIVLYGENRIDIVLYGPQGQLKTRNELVNVGQENVPPGKTWYWAGINQPGRDMVNFVARTDGTSLPKAQATIALAYGIDQKTSVGVTVQAVELEDERLT